MFECFIVTRKRWNADTTNRVLFPRNFPSPQVYRVLLTLRQSQCKINPSFRCVLGHVRILISQTCSHMLRSASFETHPAESFSKLRSTDCILESRFHCLSIRKLALQDSSVAAAIRQIFGFIPTSGSIDVLEITDGE